jgi:protoporphyrinogen oxidase
MAYELKKRGFKDVTIFEKNNYVGGKSINLKFRGIMQGLTTALISSDFKDTVIPLLKQFGLFENATFPALKNIANWPKNNDQVIVEHATFGSCSSCEIVLYPKCRYRH